MGNDCLKAATQVKLINQSTWQGCLQVGEGVCPDSWLQVTFLGEGDKDGVLVDKFLLFTTHNYNQDVCQNCCHGKKQWPVISVLAVPSIKLRTTFWVVRLSLVDIVTALMDSSGEQLRTEQPGWLSSPPSALFLVLFTLISSSEEAVVCKLIQSQFQNWKVILVLLFLGPTVPHVIVETVQTQDCLSSKYLIAKKKTSKTIMGKKIGYSFGFASLQVLLNMYNIQKIKLWQSTWTLQVSGMWGQNWFVIVYCTYAHLRICHISFAWLFVSKDAFVFIWILVSCFLHDSSCPPPLLL